MENTSHLVKWAWGSHKSTCRHMDVDRSRGNGAVSHKCFQSKQVCAVLIMIGCKSMSKGVAGKAMGPAEFLLMGTDKIRDCLMVNRLGQAAFLREEPVFWPFV